MENTLVDLLEGGGGEGMAGRMARATWKHVHYHI